MIMIINILFGLFLSLNCDFLLDKTKSHYTRLI